jgi:hypothetical protein
VLLLHGWPYDIHSYAEVTPLLAAKGYRVIVPYLRGYGTTRFTSEDRFRNGQQAALAIDGIARPRPTAPPTRATSPVRTRTASSSASATTCRRRRRGRSRTRSSKSTPTDEGALMPEETQLTVVLVHGVGREAPEVAS